jgi:hypothetical protein
MIIETSYRPVSSNFKLSKWIVPEAALKVAIFSGRSINVTSTRSLVSSSISLNDGKVYVWLVRFLSKKISIDSSPSTSNLGAKFSSSVGINAPVYVIFQPFF